MKKLEILIVEDNKNHLRDAKNFMDGRIADGAPITAIYVETLDEAMKEMQSRRYDGVISDVFFPESEGNYGKKETLEKCGALLRGSISNEIERYKRIHKGASDEDVAEFAKQVVECAKEDGEHPGRWGFIFEYFEWMQGKSEAPLGVLVSELALSQKIPVVLATSTYHHGAKTQLVFEYAKSKQIKLVDAYAGAGMENSEAPKKNWDEALNQLLTSYKA